MQTKRSFLALFSSALSIAPLASSQSEDEPKPLREREVNLKGRHQSLKEYYLELISQDDAIKKQFLNLEKKLIGENDVHYQGPGTPTVIPWLPRSKEFARQENDTHERFLILHPLEWFKPHYVWATEAIFSEFECVTKSLENDSGEILDKKRCTNFLDLKR